MVKALGSGIESRDEATAAEAAAIVRCIAVLEAVGQEEIDDFVLCQPLSIVAGVAKSKIALLGVTAAVCAESVDPTALVAVTLNV